MTLAVICALSLGAAAGCGGSGDSSSPTPRATGVALGLRSPALDGGRISARYTCDGENISPPLTWNRVPADAKSVALVMQDADASSGTLNSDWTMWGLSTRSTGLRDGQVPSGTTEGRNDLGKTGYSGPCPPKGAAAHRYVFRLHALDAELDLPAGSDSSAGP